MPKANRVERISLSGGYIGLMLTNPRNAIEEKCRELNIVFLLDKAKTNFVKKLKFCTIISGLAATLLTAGCDHSVMKQQKEVGNGVAKKQEEVGNERSINERIKEQHDRVAKEYFQRTGKRCNTLNCLTYAREDNENARKFYEEEESFEITIQMMEQRHDYGKEELIPLQVY